MLKNKTILILGAGIMQLPAIKLAKQSGLRIIVADSNANAVGVPLADIFEKIDLKQMDQMAAMARSYKSANRLDGVFTSGTDFSTTVAYVAEKCGLPGIPYETALKATDKARMRSVFTRHKVPQPAYISLNQTDDPLLALKKLSLPLVIKPVDNMGARGVQYLGHESELEPAFKTAIDSSRTRRAIIEEYMPGPELSLDALVYRGRVTVTGIADRDIRYLPYFVEMGHTMPTELNSDILKRVEQVFIQGIQALGINSGAAKGDIKVTPDGVKVGEIAARLSGGYMSGWTYPYASGIKLTLEALRIALGLPPRNLKPKFNKVSAEKAFISIPGIVNKITGLERIKRIKGIKECFVRIKAGDPVRLPTNNVEKCGNVITQAFNRELAIEAANQGLKSIFIRLVPDNTVTESFLFKIQSGFLEHMTAFKLIRGSNLAALKKMPLLVKNSGFHSEWEWAVLNLPEIDREPGRDWHAVSLDEALQTVKHLTGIRFLNRITHDVNLVGRYFWNAFLKGGIQGGVYCIDTLKKRLKAGETLTKYAV